MDSQKLELKPRVRFRAIDEEGVLINLESGRVIVVNEVGLRLVELLRKPLTVEELANTITAEFDVGDDQVSEDINRYIVELDAENLLLRS